MSAKGGCLPGGVIFSQACVNNSVPGGGVCLGDVHHPPWTEFLTHACENITSYLSATTVADGNYSQKKSENDLSSKGKTRNKNYQSTPKLYCRCTVIVNVPATWLNLGYVNQIVR